MISQGGGRVSQKYRRFVADAMGGEIESPLKEVSHRKALKKAGGVGAILQVTCSRFKVSWDDLLYSKGEARNIPIYSCADGLKIGAVELFLKVWLDHFQLNMYIPTGNPQDEGIDIDSLDDGETVWLVIKHNRPRNEEPSYTQTEETQG